MLHKARENEWEPGRALTEALEGIPLFPGSEWDGHLARLGSLVEGALGELGRLERRRDLSDSELAQKEALEELEGLLAASRADGPDG